MGVRCKISRNKNGEIDSVKSPSGSNSSLFRDAVKLLKDKEKALEAWAMAYTPGFIRHFGNWLRNSEDYDLKNGEPLLDDVVKYMAMKTYAIGNLTGEECRDAVMFARTGGFRSIKSLAGRIIDTMVEDGSITVNRRTLARSGLYTGKEIDNIMMNPSAQKGLSTLLRMIVYTSSEDISDYDRAYYFASNDAKDIPEIGDGFVTGGTSLTGERTRILPSVIEQAIMDTAAGQRDRSEFDRLISSLYNRFPQFVEKYNEDSSYADGIFNLYSDARLATNLDLEWESSVNGERVTHPASKRGMQILSFASTNPNYLNSAREDFDKFLTMEYDPSNQTEMKKALREVEKSAALFGIDIVGISDMTLSETNYNRIYDMVTLLDMYVSSMHNNGADLDTEFLDSVDSVFGERGSQFKPVFLNVNTGGLRLFYSESGFSDKEMFERRGLIRVAPNTYARVNIDGYSTSDLYNVAVNISRLRPNQFPLSVFPASVIKNGVLDTEALESVSNEEIMDSMRMEVLRRTDYSNSENMVLCRMIYGLPLELDPYEDIDIQSEFNSYMDGIRPSDRNDRIELYRDVLTEKANRSKAYNDYLQYIDFKPNGEVSITVDDPMVSRLVGMSLKGDIKNKMDRIAAASRDPRLKRMLHPTDATGNLEGPDFFYMLYKKYPSLLRDEKGSNVSRLENGMVSIKGKYDNFAKVEGEVLSRIGESSEGGVYDRFDGSPAEFIAWRQNTYYDGGMLQESTENNLIEDNMPLSKNEQDALKYLEC